MPNFAIWPALVIGAAGLQVVRNAAQRELTQSLGVWGAAYVRFLYGLPFAFAWAGAIALWRGGPINTPEVAFYLWILIGAAAQAAATAMLVFAMRGRSFAVATALSKTEVLSAALIGPVLIADVLTPGVWAGVVIGAVGAFIMARVSVSYAALNAALAGAGSGFLFAIAFVSYRGAALSWNGDPWGGAAFGLCAALLTQTIGGALLLGWLQPRVLGLVARHWRASLVPGAAGAFASALLFTAMALGPSAAAVKTVQLIDVLIAWAVSRRFFREHISRVELIGAALVLAGAALSLNG